MRWGHHISPVATAPLRSAALCLIALLALGSPSWAQKTGPKDTDAKPGDTKAAPTDPDIKWQPGSKLDWSQFKGGKPKDQNHHAETVATMWPTYKCNPDGTYTLDVQAQFSQKHSTVDPDKMGPELLAHEQLHFDIAQKHAVALKKKLEEIFKAKCKCKMSSKDIDAFNGAVKAAEKAEYAALDAEQKQYDDETDHGDKKEPQKKWATNIAKDLGQPAPADSSAPKDAPKDGGSGTPKADEGPCKDCEAAEAERKKKLAALQEKLKPIVAESQSLFKQIDAIDAEISKINLDSEKAKEAQNNAKKPADATAAQNKITANNTKIKNAQEKQAPLKAKKEAVDKRREELELEIGPLQQPTHCPKCPASADNSSFEQLPGGQFAGGAITGRGDVCSPPEETYIPGTPSHFSEQYASEIPGSETPGEFVSYSVPFASDSTAYCTFGEGTSAPGTTVATGTDGSLVPPSSDSGSSQTDIPAGPGTKIATGKPMTPSDGPGKSPTDGVTPKPVDPPKPVATPVPQPTETPTTTDNPPPPDTPKTPDQPPPTRTTDTPPPDIPTTTDTPSVTIFIKASETVLDGSQTGEPIQGQVIKLVLKEKPALPTTTESRTAMDKGFDKPAPQCTTAGDGQCKVDVPAEDRSLYALKDPPRTGGKPLNNYRLAINVMKHSGGVAETTGKPVPYLNSATSDGDVTAELFKIGNRTFVRLGFNTPSGATDNLTEKYSGLLGVPIEVDICLIKEPGPPLGSEPVSYGAINQELPASVIRLRPASARVLKR